MTDAQALAPTWLVEKFVDGAPAGLYMLDMTDLTTTTDPSKARRLMHKSSGAFRATDMRKRHGGEWHPVQYVPRFQENLT